MESYIAPVTTSTTKSPGLIVIHEIWGLNDHIKDICNRFAREGYTTLAPDLLSETGIFEKISPSIFADFQDPEKRHDAQARMREAMQPILTPEYAQHAIAELKAAFEELLALPSSNGNVGVVGFCFGGSYSFHLAAHEPRLKAAVPFYGQPPSEDEIAQITCPVLAFYGEEDTALIGSLPELRERMAKYNKNFTAEVYEKTGHAFFNDQNPKAYNKEAAQDAWKKTLSFFAENLK